MQKYDKKNPKLKDKEVRRAEIKEIINSLSNLELTIEYPPIKLLYSKMKDFIENGNKLKINIPFPVINKRIKGLFSDTVNQKSWIKLENEIF